MIYGTEKGGSALPPAFYMKINGLTASAAQAVYNTL